MISGWHDRALDAAGIRDKRLRAAYERCRELNADHGRTYYLASLLLPRDRRPHVFALYAFSRTADEFVDHLTRPDPQGLLRWADQALADLRRGTSNDPVVAATAYTARSLGIDHHLFAEFLAAMRQDIHTTRYATYDDLRGYMHGSAAVVGLMMLPVLGALDERADEPAQTLGEAFQLTNFIRDVGEDLQRGRVYLPMEDLERFAVTPHDLASGEVTPALRRLLRFEIARARRLYRTAEAGVTLVQPRSRPCLTTAIRLYEGILDEVERSGYQVLSARATVSNRRRLTVAVPGLVRAMAVRHLDSRWHPAGPLADTTRL